MITVTAAGGERTYDATGWTVSADWALEVTDGAQVVAAYPPGAWQSVHRGGKEARDGQQPGLRAAWF